MLVKRPLDQWCFIVKLNQEIYSSERKVKIWTNFFPENASESEHKFEITFGESDA